VLYRGDVDAWLATRFSARALQKSEVQASQSARSARTTLREGIRTARELRTANQVLTEQIIASIRQLTERCDMLTTQGLQEPWSLPELVAAELNGAPELLPAPLPASESLTLSFVFPLRSLSTEKALLPVLPQGKSILSKKKRGCGL
jgi:hypothetical protein